MDNLWNDMVRTVVVGSERQPVSDALLAAIGMEARDDTAETALTALPAAYLMQKAAAPLRAAPASGVSAPPRDTRPICPSDALQPLMAMVVQEVYPEVLPEFFLFLNTGHLRLPSEALPPVLDFLIRKRMISPAAKTALGPLAYWLSGQNPAWAGFLKKQNMASIRQNQSVAPEYPVRVDWSAMPEALWMRCVQGALGAKWDPLESGESALTRMLLDAAHLWPKEALYSVLEYPLRSGEARQWSPPKHLKMLLQQAALRCRPADALSFGPPASDWPYAWHNELVRFHGTVKFRQRLWEIFRGTVP